MKGLLQNLFPLRQHLWEGSRWVLLQFFIHEWVDSVCILESKCWLYVSRQIIGSILCAIPDDWRQRIVSREGIRILCCRILARRSRMCLSWTKSPVNGWAPTWCIGMNLLSPRNRTRERRVNLSIWWVRHSSLSRGRLYGWGLFGRCVYTYFRMIAPLAGFAWLIAVTFHFSLSTGIAGRCSPLLAPQAKDPVNLLAVDTGGRGVVWFHVRCLWSSFDWGTSYSARHMPVRWCRLFEYVMIIDLQTSEVQFASRFFYMHAFLGIECLLS
jgi:hypothetical protein